MPLPSSSSSPPPSAGRDPRPPRRPRDGGGSSDEEGEVDERRGRRPAKHPRSHAPQRPRWSPPDGGTAATQGSAASKPDPGPAPSHGSRLPTPLNTCDDATSERRRSGGNGTAGAAAAAAAPSRQQLLHQQALQLQSVYGKPTEVEHSGNFPSPGATLGPWFCLGQLGKGTFSSIHKCLHLGAAYEASSGDAPTALLPAPPQPRGSKLLAAAKVELTSFVQSGVLEAEAGILDFLHRSLGASGAVPTYLGHYRCTTATATTAPNPPPAGDAPSSASQQSASPNAVASALLMEYLPGPDMHQLREAVMTRPTNATNSRRIHLDDAVYWAADVLLPLLRHIHSVGVVHRDVKPSNCVLRRVAAAGSSPHNNGHRGRNRGPHQEGDVEEEEGVTAEFCMVDFGLSKSVVVPEDSPLADGVHFWPENRPWQKPSHYTRRGCYRSPREQAEFRGTSMYASLRVHQLHDYCPRDDMWSLVYVFCDLVSGGLPWMQHAANRDRAACQRIKEAVHGTPDGRPDQTEQLLMGDLYHVAKARKDRHDAASAAAANANGDAAGGGSSQGSGRTIEVPDPLPLSQDPWLVQSLREIFAHLGTLQFWDTPDYDLIQRNIRRFRDTRVRLPPVPRVSYDAYGAAAAAADRGRTNLLDARRHMPRAFWQYETDPLEEDVFSSVEEDSSDKKGKDGGSLSRLPLELRHRFAQMGYHASRPDGVPPRVALRDWMKATLPLLYGEWDTPKYEGRHRTSSDGLKRELYLSLLQRCLAWAATFGYFRAQSYYDGKASSLLPGAVPKRPSSSSAVDVEKGADDDARKAKRTREDSCSASLNVSRALFGLKLAIQVEEAKKSGAQATRLNFS